MFALSEDNFKGLIGPFKGLYERLKKIVPAGITKIKTITPQGFWPDLRGEKPCGLMVLIND